MAILCVYFTLLSPKLSPKIELNRKRESELTKLRKDHEAQEQEHEHVLSDMRKKHAEALRQLEEQLETSQKAKTKSVSLLTLRTSQLGLCH